MLLVAIVELAGRSMQLCKGFVHAAVKNCQRCRNGHFISFEMAVQPCPRLTATSASLYQSVTLHTSRCKGFCCNE